MATIRAFTTIEQSRKLAEILPLESADMWYDNNGESTAGRPEVRCGSFVGLASKNIPCWSLVSLLDVLPKGTNISVPKPTNELGYCCWNQYDEIYADNPVDACYEMIIKLHEMNLL